MSSLLSGLQRFDILQHASDSLLSLPSREVLPNFRRARAHPLAPLSWLGDRLIGIFLAGIGLYFLQPLTSVFVTETTSFLLRYNALLEYFIEVGTGPGVWGVKLNAALISSAGRLWTKSTTVLATVLPPPLHPSWFSAARSVFQCVALYTVVCGGWSTGVALLTDIARMIFLPLFLLQRVVAVLFELELSALLTLCRLLIGRKYNVLRLRVDSHDFDMEHYTLGTVFFTLLFFLLPTVAAPLLFIIQPLFILMHALAALPAHIPLVSLVMWLVRSESIFDGVAYQVTPQGLVPRRQMPGIGKVLAPMWQVTWQPLLALLPAFFLGRPLPM